MEYRKMIIIIEGVTFEKRIGNHRIYAKEYGVNIPNSNNANTFDEMVTIAKEWLKTQE